MSPVRWHWLLACALLTGCANCEDTPAPARAPQLVDDEDDEPENKVPLPPPEGTALEPEAMKPWAPDVVSGFTATGPTELRTIPIANGGKLTSVHRNYQQGTQEMRLEIRDTQHAPALAQLVTSQQGQDRKSEDSVVRGITVAGHPTLLQWHRTTKTAMVNVLVADRVLVNVKLKPVEDADAAVALVTALPLAELEKLATTAPTEQRADPAATTTP